MRLFSCIFLCLLTNIITSVCAQERPDYSDTLKRLLDDETIQLTDAKLEIDRLIDPASDPETTALHIRGMAEQAILLAGSNPSAVDKVAALKKLIYTPGKWNGNKAYSYDFNNPRGRRATDKTLATYIKRRKGNCVSMPLLFLSVAEQMGVEINVTTAPTHLFIQFENPGTGEVQHLETTSGADPQRLIWQRKVLPMTDRAIESGMYFKRLNRREMIVVMAETLLQDLSARGLQQERMEVAKVILDAFPQNDVALLHLYDAYRFMIDKNFKAKYPSSEDIPKSEMPIFQTWAKAQYQIGMKLRQLGWRPVKNIGTPQASFADKPVSPDMSAMNMAPASGTPPNPMAQVRQRSIDPLIFHNPMQQLMPPMPGTGTVSRLPYPGMKPRPNNPLVFPYNW